MRHKKKLIEVALPLDAINAASAREKSIRHGHPSTLHLWWARRPLAAARAVIFAQMVDDPSAHPDLFPTEKKQEKERQRLFKIIEDLVEWENTTNEEVLERARNEIWQSWRRTCAENADHPRARELFDRHKLPAFHDPFAGGGTLPLEAQRLGLEAYASDLNPVAVLINKAMIEIPPKFAGRPPVNPEARADRKLFAREWNGAEGLAEDVRYYGKWMRDQAEKRIGHLYPKVEITPELAKGRPDLQRYVGQQLTAIAWLWARTVKSPNPAFAHIDVPLASTFMLCTRKGREAFVEPVVDALGYRFEVRTGMPSAGKAYDSGTKTSRGGHFRCLMSGVPIPSDYLKSEGRAGRLGARLMAVVADSASGRLYISPNTPHEQAGSCLPPDDVPDTELPSGDTANFWCTLYGVKQFVHLFTGRQLNALATLSQLVGEARQRVVEAASIAGDQQGTELALLYADAVSTYLAFCVDKSTLTNTTQASWQKDPDRLTQGFSRQAIPMVWDYAEANPLSDAGGGFGITSHAVAKVLERLPTGGPQGRAVQQDASSGALAVGRVVSTDPPYYDNISYADLSDYFYIWLRQSLRRVHPGLFSTVVVPKNEELVATIYRHGNKATAEQFFLNGMTGAMRRIAAQAHPAFPLTVYYAFKQAENTDNQGLASTGWETFLGALIEAGLTIQGTWPVRTELVANLKKGSNALASSIVLVCRPRANSARPTTRGNFVAALKTELPIALHHLQRGNTAPVDLAQAAIGPGMGVFTQFSAVVDAEGKPLSVRQALALINEVLDEALTEQEGDFDVDSRWALAWFDQYGFVEGPYGIAEVLSKAKGTSVEGLVTTGILMSRAGKVRLLSPDDLPEDWDPEDDQRTNLWEMLHHLIRVLEHRGESAAAQLLTKYGSKADIARELAYRLYTSCERRKRAKEAASYNGLVQSWPEIVRLASEQPTASVEQGGLFDQE